MKCKIYDTIDDIEEESWSALAGDTIPDQQYQWFQTIERTVSWFQPRYVVIKENSDVKAIAALNFESGYSLGNVDNHPALKNMMKTLFGSPVILEATAPHASFPGVFLSEDKKAEKELFHGLKTLLKTENVMAVALINFYEEKPFQKYGYATFSMSPNTCLTIKWNTFHQYLNSWPPKRRHSIVSSLKKGEKKGLHIEYTRSFASHAEQLYALKKNVAIHNNNLGSVLPCEFYRDCMQYLNHMGEIALCFKEDQVVAFSFSLNTETVCTQKFIGLNYQHREAYYFLYADAVKRGIEKGYEKMYFGRGTYTFKERLGCKPTGITSYIKMKNPLFNPLVKHAFRLFGIHRKGVHK